MSRNHLKFNEKELERLNVIQKVIDRKITQAEAAEILSLTTRQIRRMVKRVKTEGSDGILHKAKGRASNHRYPIKIRDMAIELYSMKYKHISLTSVVEKLSEEEDINIHSETLRKWLVESGDWENNGRQGIDEEFLTTEIILEPLNSGTPGRVALTGKGNGTPSKAKKNKVKKNRAERDTEEPAVPAKKYIPPPDHPWRRQLYPQYADKYKRED